MEKGKNKTYNKSKIIRNCIVALFWIAFIVICFVNRDKITVDSILNYTPSNYLLAILVLLVLFAVKSVSVFIYCGILYAASGIIFPLPLAVTVNIIGTFIMISIPYLIGYKAGNKTALDLAEKHPKIQLVMDMQNKNDMFLCFLVRIIGILPSDLLGIYLGASGIRYWRYAVGSLAGMLPSTVTFAIMGTSADNPTSPTFIISVGIEIALMIVSISAFAIWKKCNNKKLLQGENQDEK